jgi:hypothetical protein
VPRLRDTAVEVIVDGDVLELDRSRGQSGTVNGGDQKAWKSGNIFANAVAVASWNRGGGESLRSAAHGRGRELVEEDS